MTGVTIRRATPGDLEFLAEVLNDDDVRPFLARGAALDRETLAEELERQEAEPETVGRFVIEVDGEPAGTMSFERTNRRSRIAHCGGLAIHPRFRGRRLADEAARIFQRHLLFDLGYHRLEMVVYGFNERAQRHAERAGWIKEGVKRKAYRRDDGWTDGIMYSAIREDFVLRDYIERHNDAVLSGDFAAMIECFAESARLEFDGVPIGPFAGRDAIAQAYRERPPDDEVEILDQREEGDTIVAGYGWRRKPGKRAGELLLTHDGARITKLVVTFA